MTEEEIIRKIREKLNDGRLPTHLPTEPCPGWPICKFCDGPKERS